MTQLADLVAVSQKVAGTGSRLDKVAALAACLRALAGPEVPVALSYLSGEIPQGRLGVAWSGLQQGMAREAAPAPSLALRDVDEAFAAIGATKGKGASAERARRLGDLLARATAEERDFLARLIAGELRQGALKGVMLEAVAAAAALPVDEVRRAAMSAGGMAEVAQAALAQGAAGLGRFSIRVMRPVLPMLSQSARSVEEALERLGTAAFEWKLDGARVQVHKSGAQVRVYTRSLKEVTARVPEIVEAVSALGSDTLLLDGEAIALKPDGFPHSFQLTMRRFGRKLEVEATRAELPLSVFFFDCLLRDGEPLAGRPASERFAALAQCLPEALVIPRTVTDEPACAAAFLEEAVRRGHEGVMAKALDGRYEAGRRGAGWLKIKRANTLDLVVLAAEWGHGRRKGWLSNLHLGARDPESGGFVMLGKTFKGLTDAMLEWQTQELLDRALTRDDWTVYVRPELVVEIEFNEVQRSSQYPGGFALRFARVKAYRPDKRIEEADTMSAVRGIFEAQSAPR